MELDTTTNNEPIDGSFSSTEKEPIFTPFSSLFFERKVGSECKKCKLSYLQPTKECSSCKNPTTEFVWYERFCVERIVIILVVMLITSIIGLLLVGFSEWYYIPLISGFYTTSGYVTFQVFGFGGGFFKKILSTNLELWGKRWFEPKRFYIEGIIVIIFATTSVTLFINALNEPESNNVESTEQLSNIKYIKVNEANISFQYPDTWKLMPSGESHYYINDLNQSLIPFGRIIVYLTTIWSPTEKAEIIITISNCNQPISIKNLFDERQKVLNNALKDNYIKQINKLEIISHKGYEGLIEESTNLNSEQARIYRIIINNNIIDISLVVRDGDKLTEYENIFNKVIETLNYDNLLTPFWKNPKESELKNIETTEQIAKNKYRQFNEANVSFKYPDTWKLMSADGYSGLRDYFNQSLLPFEQTIVYFTVIKSPSEKAFLHVSITECNKPISAKILFDERIQLKYSALSDTKQINKLEIISHKGYEVLVEELTKYDSVQQRNFAIIINYNIIEISLAVRYSDKLSDYDNIFSKVIETVNYYNFLQIKKPENERNTNKG
jgi:hypothetical protein